MFRECHAAGVYYSLFGVVSMTFRPMSYTSCSGLVVRSNVVCDSKLHLKRIYCGVKPTTCFLFVGIDWWFVVVRGGGHTVTLMGG